MIADATARRQTDRRRTHRRGRDRWRRWLIGAANAVVITLATNAIQYWWTSASWDAERAWWQTHYARLQAAAGLRLDCGEEK